MDAGGTKRGKVMSLADAATLVTDGDVVGMQGGPTQCAPMALVRELIRAGRRELSLVTLSAGLPVDWLAAAGCLSHCTFAVVSMEHYGLCQRFRAGVESGQISVEEISETGMHARLAAAARGLPFLPTRGMIGTDLLAVDNDALRVIDDPFGGPPVVACRALSPDVTVLHAHRADVHGNIGVEAGVRNTTIEVLSRASKRVIVTVERLVETDVLREAPHLTILPAFAVDAVVPIAHGAHPTSLFPDYCHDGLMFDAWNDASSDEQSSRAFVERYMLEPPDHAAYLERVGGHRRLERLRRWEDM